MRGTRSGVCNRLRILLVSYYFPPYNTIGSVRPGKLASHWYSEGHDVAVLCGAPDFPKTHPVELPLDQVEVVEAVSLDRLIRRGVAAKASNGQSGALGSASPSPVKRWLARAYKTLFHWPDGQRSWSIAAVQRAKELHQAQPFDLIVASVPAFSALGVLHGLSLDLNVLTIADYRDPWTDGHFYQAPEWKRFLERRHEARWLKNVDAITTVTQGMADKFTHHDKPVWVIANGYDRNEIPVRPAMRNPGPLRLVFTGNVYPSNNDIRPFCEGLKLFADAGHDFEFTICGHNIEGLVRELELFGLRYLCDVKGVLPRSETLQLQADCDVGLLFTWRGEAGVRGTKVYEYMGTGLRVLSVGPKGCDTGKMVEQAGGGDHVISGQDVVATLTRWAHEFGAKGTLVKPLNEGFDFSRQAQFQELDRRVEALFAERGEK